MLIAKCEAWLKADTELELETIDQRISGGSSESELNELQVRPTKLPSGRTVVTTVTPVGNAPRARRSSSGS